MTSERYAVSLKGEMVGTQGSAMLEIDTDFVHLTPHDRRFVFYLIDVMRAYKDGTLVFPSEAPFHPPSDRKMDLNANVDEIPF